MAGGLYIDPATGKPYTKVFGGNQANYLDGTSGVAPTGDPAQAAPAAAPAPAAPAAPAPVQPGLKPPTPMTGDLALNKKMEGENYFAEHAKDFTDPGQAGQFTKDAIAKGGTPTTNNANEAWGMWKNMSPADMSSYYANAGRQGTEALNKSMAAKGAYGSSAANDQQSEMLGNLAADRAKNEAQYGLQRMGLGGQLASASDQSSIAGSANDRAWTLGLGGLAQGADAGRLAGLTAGQNAANSAENAGINRIGGLFNATMGLGNATSGVIGGANRDIFNNDKDLFGSGVAAGVAPYSEGAANAVGHAGQVRSDAQSSSADAAALAKLFQSSGASGKIQDYFK